MIQLSEVPYTSFSLVCPQDLIGKANFLRRIQEENAVVQRTCQYICVYNIFFKT